MSKANRFLVGVFLLLCIAAVVAGRSKPETAKTILTQADGGDGRTGILEKLAIKARTYTGRGGDPLTTNFTLNNQNDFSIKDFTVRYTIHGNSGTAITSRNKTYYEVVAAKGSKSVRNASLGFMPDQGVSVSADVVDYGAP